MPFLPSSRLAALSESRSRTCSFFPINRTSLQRGVPWWHGAMLAWDGMLQTRWNCLPFVLNGYSQVPPPHPTPQFWSFFSGLQSSPRAALVVDPWLLLIFVCGGRPPFWWCQSGEFFPMYLEEAVPLPQPKLLVFTWFFLSLLFLWVYMTFKSMSLHKTFPPTPLIDPTA